MLACLGNAGLRIQLSLPLLLDTFVSCVNGHNMSNKIAFKTVSILFVHVLKV